MVDDKNEQALQAYYKENEQVLQKLEQETTEQSCSHSSLTEENVKKEPNQKTSKNQNKKRNKNRK